MDELGEIIALLKRVIELLEGEGNGRKTIRRGGARRSTDGAGQATKELLAYYADCYKARFGSFPIIDGKAAGVAGSLLKSLPLQRAKDLVSVFLQMQDRWFTTRSFALDVLASNLNKVALALANGAENTEDKEFWGKVFNDERMLRERDGKAQADLRGEVLSHYPTVRAMGRPKKPV